MFFLNSDLKQSFYLLNIFIFSIFLQGKQMYILDWLNDNFQIVLNSYDDLVGFGLIARENHCCIDM